jgi:hypothetical protein
MAAKGHEPGRAGNVFAIGGPMDDLMDVLESRSAATRYLLARRVQRQGLRGVVRQVQPVRKPAAHTGDAE